MTGGIESFWNVIDYISMFSYLSLIDTNIPYNLNFLLNVFESTSLRAINENLDL